MKINDSLENMTWIDIVENFWVKTLCRPVLISEGLRVCCLRFLSNKILQIFSSSKLVSSKRSKISLPRASCCGILCLVLHSLCILAGHSWMDKRKVNLNKYWIRMTFIYKKRIRSGQSHSTRKNKSRTAMKS